MPGDFTDLIAWRQSVLLVRETTALARRLRGPGASSAADQVRRAAESIPANIAEGYGRWGARDFARFLRIATSSATELESHLRVAVANHRLAGHDAEPAIARCRRVRALLRGLIQSLATREGRRRSSR